MTGHGVAIRLVRSGSVLAVALAAGCASVPSFTPQDPAQGAAHDSGLTATRAGYVSLMLENTMSTTSHARVGQVFAVVAKYGGGYVTSAHLTGAGGTPEEQLTFDTVIGATAVTDRMQGETYFGPSAIGCFRFTVGYYGHVSYHGIACPADTSASAAAAEARRQAAAAQAVRSLPAFVKDKPVPLDLATAQQDGIGVLAPVITTASPRPSAIASAPPLNPIDFATTNGVSALAVPQADGAPDRPATRRRIAP